jgi:hypothetical protein
VPPSAGLGDIGADVGVDGEDLRFHTHCLGVPAGERFTVMFRNLDDGVPRNISVYPMQECLLSATVEEIVPTCDPGNPIFRGETIMGVDEIVYELGPLEPGTYYFQDDVHPQANGVLVVT